MVQIETPLIDHRELVLAAWHCHVNSLPSPRPLVDILHTITRSIRWPTVYYAAAEQLIHASSPLVCGLKQAARLEVYGA